MQTWTVTMPETCCSLKPPSEPHAKPFPVFYLCWKFSISSLLFLAAFIQFLLLATFSAWPTLSDLILTPPTFSKWSPSLSKSIRCPLKDQVNSMSREWSWDTWQGRTMLSPTVTSMLKGDTMTRVGSTNSKERGKKRIILVLLRSRDTAGLREILSSDPWGRALNQQVNDSNFGFILSLDVGLKHLINPPESPSSHHPDEEGGKKKLEKSAAGLKGSIKTFYQRFSHLNLLTSKSCFTHTLLTMVIKKLFCCSWIKCKISKTGIKRY